MDRDRSVKLRKGVSSLLNLLKPCVIDALNIK